MTKARALIRARMELGPTAYLKDQGASYRRQNARFVAGKVSGSQGLRLYQCLGAGPSWEEAIEDAIREVHGLRVLLVKDEIVALLAGDPEPARTRLESALTALEMR